MIDTKALRRRILDLAIQGKLTEQLESDGTAEKLYQKIQEEKQRLIKEGKIKKEKPLPPILENEISYEIPDSWIWVRLGNICSIINGDRGKNYPAKSTLKHEGIPFISALNLNGRDVTIDEKLLCLSDVQYDRLGSGKLEKDDLVICIRGSLGKHGRYQLKKGAIASSLVINRIYVEKEKLGNYEMIWLDSSLFPNEILKYNSGTAQPNLAAENLSKFLMPLPPLAEQKRIVACVEEIFRILDTIDEAQEKYSADMESLKAKLITAGIQGKLTQQLESDGTAEELYQQIQDEKQRLIKEGKIKKEKPLPPIKAEEIPFKIPSSWKWVRLSELCKSVMDGDHQPPPQTAEGMPFIVISNLSDGAIDFSNTRHVPKEYFDNLSIERIAEQGDILFTVTGSFGIPIKIDTDQQFCFQRHIALLKPINCIENDYLFRVLKSDFIFKQCDDVALGVAQRTVGIKSLRNFLIPLPPLAEQKRIADKLDELLSVLK